GTECGWGVFLLFLFNRPRVDDPRFVSGQKFAFPFGAEPDIVALGGLISSSSFCFSADLGSSIRGASRYSSCIGCSSEQGFDFLHVRMGNARLPKFFEVIEHRLAKGPSVV